MRPIRVLMVVFVLVMVSSVGLAGAQTGPYGPVYCGDLAEADCEIIVNAETPASAAYNGSGVVTVTVADTPYVVGFTATGSYLTDEEALNSLKSLGEMPMAEMYSSIYGDVDTLLGVITDAFQAVDADMSLTIDVPEELTGGALPVPFTMDLWLVDGVGYTDVAAFSFADPTLEGVYGVDFVALYTDLFNQPELIAMFEEMGTQMEEQMADSPLMDMDQTAMLEEFTTIERLDDQTENGQTMAVFETTLDYGAMFQSDFLRDLMDAQLAAQADIIAEEDPEISIEDAEAMMSAVMDAYAVAFEGTTLTITQTIGTEDNYIHGTSMTLFMDVDPSEAFATFNEGVAGTAISEEMGEMSAEDLGIPPFTVDFTFDLTQSDFDTIDGIALPEEAQLVPQEMLDF